VTSVLVSLESQLGSQRAEKSEPCNDVVQRTIQDESQLLTLLHMVFYTISTAMRFEPANAKYFHHEVQEAHYNHAVINYLKIYFLRIILILRRFVNRLCATHCVFLDVFQRKRKSLKRIWYRR